MVHAYYDIELECSDLIDQLNMQINDIMIY